MMYAGIKHISNGTKIPKLIDCPDSKQIAIKASDTSTSTTSPTTSPLVAVGHAAVGDLKEYDGVHRHQHGREEGVGKAAAPPEEDGDDWRQHEELHVIGQIPFVYNI